MSQCRNLGSACPEPPGEQQLRSMKRASQSLSISISAVLCFIALMVLFFCALLAACWPPRRRISGATTSKTADIQWNPPDLPSELCDSALQEKKVMLDSGCHAAFTMIFARSTSMSSKDVHLNGHLLNCGGERWGGPDFVFFSFNFYQRKKLVSSQRFIILKWVQGCRGVKFMTEILRGPDIITLICFPQLIEHKDRYFCWSHFDKLSRWKLD